MLINRLVRKARQTGSHLKNHLFPGALILMYHRVAEADSDPWSLCVSPKHFAEHLEVIAKYRNPIPLGELTSKLDNARSLDRAIAITFDDGYADNLYNAKPILAKYQIPATVFVTTGSIDCQHEFWWDELDRLLLQPGTLPQLFQLIINEQSYCWNLATSAHYTAADARQYCHWRMEIPIDPTPRHTLYRFLYQQLQFLPDRKREQLLESIRVYANTERLVRTTHRTLNRLELLALAAGGSIEIGAHTVTHPFLAQMPLAEQQQEIQKSKDALEGILGHEVVSFSYPNGSYALETMQIVRQIGFNSACSSVNTKIYPRNTNNFLLPRFMVEDWDGDTFARWLSELTN
jgi:peptidoglycan/xylan/chitin deacetylase (PgdA/CDA1 family)